MSPIYVYAIAARDATTPSLLPLQPNEYAIIGCFTDGAAAAAAALAAEAESNCRPVCLPHSVGWQCANRSPADYWVTLQTVATPHRTTLTEAAYRVNRGWASSIKLCTFVEYDSVVELHVRSIVTNRNLLRCIATVIHCDVTDNQSTPAQWWETHMTQRLPGLKLITFRRNGVRLRIIDGDIPATEVWGQCCHLITRHCILCIITCSCGAQGTNTIPAFTYVDHCWTKWLDKTNRIEIFPQQHNLSASLPSCLAAAGSKL